MAPVDREHYEVARTFEGFFDKAEFEAEYLKRFPNRRLSQLDLARYDFSRKRGQRGPQFLWGNGAGSYVFVGFNGAPKHSQGDHKRSSRREARTGKAEAGVLTTPGLHLNLDRAREVAERLYRDFSPDGRGIFGERMSSQDIKPASMEPGSREHLLYLTFTNCVNRHRVALDLWQRASAAWSDPQTRYLFEPREATRFGFDVVSQDLQRLKISKKHRADATAWFGIAKVLSEKWNGDLKEFLADCEYDASKILECLHHDKIIVEGKTRSSFALLRGPKIAPLWIRMLRDSAGLNIIGLEKMDIAVDVHVCRATLCSGAISGTYRGRAKGVFDAVRQLWREGTQGLQRTDGKLMVPLDIDEALWTLSRLGCSARGNGDMKPCAWDCPLAGMCARGHASIRDDRCDIAL